MELTQPVLKSQSRDLLKVTAVRRKKGRIVDDRNRSNFQIRRRDSHAIGSQQCKGLSRLAGKGNDFPFGEELKHMPETAVGTDLVCSITTPANFRDPAPRLFFKRNHRRNWRIDQSVQSLEKTRTSLEGLWRIEM